MKSGVYVFGINIQGGIDNRVKLQFNVHQFPRCSSYALSGKRIEMELNYANSLSKMRSSSSCAYKSTQNSFNFIFQKPTQKQE